eukprot:COSAG02_NODE_21732_length_777_cov_0.839233_1_plen_62_part_10
MDGLLPLERNQLQSALHRCYFSVSIQSPQASLTRHTVVHCTRYVCSHALQQGDAIVTQGTMS